MRPRRAGFTLVEVLVALVVLSVMSLLAWRGLDAMLRSRDINQQVLERSTRLQSVVGQWDTDMAQVFDTRSDVPALSFDGATLRLTRTQGQGVQVVSWSLQAGSLYRWASAPVTTALALREAAKQSQQTLDGDTRRLKVLDAVEAWQLYFFRGNSWSNAASSDDVQSEKAKTPDEKASGTGLTRKVLPSGVRMKLDFAPASGFNGPLIRQVMVPPQA